jgi:hypothetical protein
MAALPAVLVPEKTTMPPLLLVIVALPAVLMLKKSMLPEGLLVKAALPPLTTTPAPVNPYAWLLLKV